MTFGDLLWFVGQFFTCVIWLVVGKFVAVWGWVADVFWMLFVVNIWYSCVVWWRRLMCFLVLVVARCFCQEQCFVLSCVFLVVFCMTYGGKFKHPTTWFLQVFCSFFWSLRLKSWWMDLWSFYSVSLWFLECSWTWILRVMWGLHCGSTLPHLWGNMPSNNLLSAYYIWIHSKTARVCTYEYILLKTEQFLATSSRLSQARHNKLAPELIATKHQGHLQNGAKQLHISSTSMVGNMNTFKYMHYEPHPAKKSKIKEWCWKAGVSCVRDIIFKDLFNRLK